MPITVSQLKKLVEKESQRSEESPADVYRNAVAGLLAPTFQQMQRTLSVADVMRNGNIVLAEGERIRREAEARDLAVVQAEEIRQLREEVQGLREETGAGSRKALLPSWWAVLIAVLSLLVTVLFWLLAH